LDANALRKRRIQGVVGSLPSGRVDGVPVLLGSVMTYLTPAQVAQLLKVSPKTISRWALQDASMPVLRLGRVVRFPEQRLMVWLQQREQGLSGRAKKRVP